ncbi:MAG: hypothetical protein V4735_08695 [Pseudomonadota bacterium]
MAIRAKNPVPVLCTIILLIMMVGTPIYLWRLFVQDSIQVNVNYPGRAYADTIELNFGLTPFLKSYHRYSLKNIDQCHVKDLSASIPCLLIYTHSSGFYQACAWWRFEDCAHIAADPMVAKDPALLQTVVTIIENPCHYLPSEEEIRNESKRKSKYLTVEITDYLTARKTLACDSRKQKIIPVQLRLTPEETITIQSNVGADYGR